MSIPPRVQQFLTDRGIAFELLAHPQVASTAEVTSKAYVPAHKVLRAVALSDHGRPLVAVFPLDRRLDLDALNRELERDYTPMAAERAAALFPGCDLRTLTPLAAAFGVKAIVDESVYRLDEVFFHGGAGNVLVRVAGDDFRTLMRDAWRGFNITSPLPGTANNPEASPRIDLRERLSHIDSLPAMPTMAQRILQVRANPYAGARDLAAVVELDPSLAAQVIRYARSPFFAYPGEVDSVQHAISRVLGYDLVMNIALGLATGRTFRIQLHGPLGLYAFWRQAVHCAALTQALANTLPVDMRPRPGLAYLAGLLHNFGFLALGHLFETEFFWLNRQAAKRPEVPVMELEREMFQVDHAEVGGWLLSAWNLPAEVVAACRGHHDADYAGEHALYPQLVLLANRLLRSQGMGDEPDTHLPEDLLTRLGISAEQCQAVLAAVWEGQGNLEAMARQMAA